ncbi:glycosyltransferase [Akkermansiaceae bacterium]|nr:glycosyltransferase [Akkermansiaceae bacterium]
MNIWIFNASEIHAFSGNGQRAGRAMMQARAMVARGHEVHWFTSDFDHASKSFSREGNAEAARAEGILLHPLSSLGYPRNVSIQRLRDHAHLKHQLEAEIAGMPNPDLILASYPIIEFASVAVRYGNLREIPVVLDVRDMWPEIFVYGVPRWMQPLARPILSFYGRSGRKALASATALCGITEEFVDWAVEKAGRPRQPMDRAFPLCFQRQDITSAEFVEADQFWTGLGLTPGSSRPVFAFLGTLGYSLNIEPLLAAAKKFGQGEGDPCFVFCGVGDRLEEYRRIAQGHRNILFPGWVNSAQGQALLRLSWAGLNPLPLRPDFLASINGKTSEYLSAGLPIVSSPKEGAVFRLLREQSCGVSYDPLRTGDTEKVLRELLNSPERRQGMANASERLYAEQFMAETVFERMAVYLEQVAQGGPKTG